MNAELDIVLDNYAEVCLARDKAETDLADVRKRIATLEAEQKELLATLLRVANEAYLIVLQTTLKYGETMESAPYWTCSCGELNEVEARRCAVCDRDAAQDARERAHGG